MPAARSSQPLTLKLLSPLAAQTPYVAAGYGLPVSTYVAVLVWNDFLRPNRTLSALPRAAGKLVREPLSCSLRASHHALARRRAKQQRMTLNSYLEALIHAQLARPIEHLVIFKSPTRKIRVIENYPAP